MRFKVKIGEFTEQLAQAAITVDLKSMDQPNSKVLLRAVTAKDGTGALYFYSTNQIAKTFIKSPAEILTAGDVLVDAKTLLGGLQGRDQASDLDFQMVAESKIVVKIGRNQFKLPLTLGTERLTKEADALPFRKPSMGKISARLLNDFISRTTFCIPSDSNGQQRFAVDALHIQQVEGVYQGQATDGNIVSLNYGSAPDPESNIPSLLIPQEVLNALQKILARHLDEDIEMVNAVSTQSGKVQELFFRMKGVLFGCSMRPGEYPDINLLMSYHTSSFEFRTDRNNLKAALARANNFVVEPQRHVQLIFDEANSVTVKAATENSDITDVLGIEVTSGAFEKLSVTANLDYLAPAIAALKGEMITLGVSSEKQRAIIVHSQDRNGEDGLLIDSKYALSPINTSGKNA